MPGDLRNTIKRIAATLTDGMLLSGHPDVLPMELDRDFDEIEKLLILEQWPFLRSDLDVSHAQPGGVSHVARKDGKFGGFFITHAFGTIGYLDMMIVSPDFRGSSIARPLYFRTLHELAKNGMQSYVAHTTNDSARVIGLLGFRKTKTTFTLMGLDPQAVDSSLAAAGSESQVCPLAALDEEQVICLDARIFGQRRDSWIKALMSQDSTLVWGLKRDGVLTAVAWLRSRRDNSYCIDGCSSTNPEDLTLLICSLVSAHRHVRLECFVRTGSFLHGVLSVLGFAVPEFFRKIGPLMEWRKGKVGVAGTGTEVQCLMWF